MSPADRVARVLVTWAARRWPDDLAETMAAEWRAELVALRAEGGSAGRVLAFAVSLAVSPAVEPGGVAAVSRVESWLRSLAAAAGVTLLAALLFNGVHVVQHRGGAGWAYGALAAGAAVMVVVARRSGARVLPRTVAVGGALFAFLLAGNRIAVMPFMGWADILPAVLVWTVGTALTAHLVARRVALGGRPGRRLAALAGGYGTLSAATAAGSWHAAQSLTVAWATAPAWFPLALLPGGAVTFGPTFPGGVRASELLLGNASAMAGPMLLAAVYVLTLARCGPAPVRAGRAGLDLSVPLGVAATVAALLAAEAVRRVPDGSIGVTPHRLIDNSSVFGFGFVAHTPGRIVLALVAGLLAAQVGTRRPA